MAFGYTYTLPTVTGSHTDLVVLLKTVDFPAAAVDGTVDAIADGGGPLRAYTDSGKGTQLSVDIVTFVSSGSPDVQVWIKIPTAATGNTIFIEDDAVATTQPAVGAPFGRNSAWSDYNVVLHLNETSGNYINSTGDGEDATDPGAGVTRGVPGIISVCVDCDGTQNPIVPGSPDPGYWHDSFTTATISAWATIGAGVGGPNIIIDQGGSLAGQALYYKTSPDTLHFATLQSASNVELDSTTIVAPLSPFFYIVGTYNVGAMALYIDGASEATGTNGTSIPPHANEPGIGDRNGDSIIAGANPWSGKLAEIRRKPTADPSDRIFTERDNQVSATAWGTVGAWTDGAPGATIPIFQYYYSRLRNG